jgi:hypothetical protein
MIPQGSFEKPSRAVDAAPGFPKTSADTAADDRNSGRSRQLGCRQRFNPRYDEVFLAASASALSEAGT